LMLSTSIVSADVYRPEDVRLFLTVNRLLVPRRPKTSLGPGTGTSPTAEPEDFYDMAPGFLTNKRSEFEAPRGFRGMRGKRAPFKGLRGKRGGMHPFELTEEY
ncbi:hypothetical protein PFISCL1PPCAC_209, partial [Pristionchus fissidentatus]